MIVWAKVPDRNGIIKPNPRPLLILSVHPKLKDAPFLAYAISTRQDDPAAEPHVEMPWDPNTGHCTGFYQWCAVVLRWPVFLRQDQVEEIGGSIPASMLAAIKQAIDDDVATRGG